MAALEHSSWQIVDLAGSPVRRNATGWIGSNRAGQVDAIRWSSESDFALFPFRQQSGR